MGDVAIATNPFELFVDYGVQIKGRSKALQTLLLQFTNGPGSYLATAKAVGGGGYGAVVESNQVGPEGGQILVERTVQTDQLDVPGIRPCAMTRIAPPQRPVAGRRDFLRAAAVAALGAHAHDMRRGGPNGVSRRGGCRRRLAGETAGSRQRRIFRATGRRRQRPPARPLPRARRRHDAAGDRGGRQPDDAARAVGRRQAASGKRRRDARRANPDRGHPHPRRGPR